MENTHKRELSADDEEKKDQARSGHNETKKTKRSKRSASEHNKQKEKKDQARSADEEKEKASSLETVARKEDDPSIKSDDQVNQNQVNQDQKMKYKCRMNLQLVKKAVEELSGDAKKFIEEKLDFGAMLKISLDRCPNKLVADLMDRCEFTSEYIQLVVGEHKIPVTPQVVKDVLGLPLGGNEVDSRTWLDNVQQKKEIKNYFSIVSGDEVTASAIIEHMTDADYLIQTRGFFTVLWNKFISPDTGPYIRGSDFNITSDMEQFAKKNWCKYVCDKLVESIRWWQNQVVKPSTKERFVPGCGVILLLLLLDKMKYEYSNKPKDYTIPAICHYTDNDVDAMILDFEIEALVSGTVKKGTCVAKVKKPIATKVAARKKREPTAMVPSKALDQKATTIAGRMKRKPIAMVPSKAPDQKATTHEAGQILLPEEMASFFEQYNSTVDWLQHSKTMIADFMKRMSAELLAKTPKCPEPSTDLSTLKVFTSKKKKWYQEMVVDRTHLNKHTGLYIVLMMDGWVIKEYQYVEEFKPFGLLSNSMMHLISRCWNEKYLDNVILEMPAVRDLMVKKTGAVLDRQLSQENLKRKNKIFVPVINDGHWFLIVVDISKKLKYVLDSLKPRTATQLSIDVLQLLEHHLKTIGYDISDYDAVTPVVAEQENLFDCGFHVLLYIRRDKDTLATISQNDIIHIRMEVAHYIFHHKKNKVCHGLEDSTSRPVTQGTPLHLRLSKAKEALKNKDISSCQVIQGTPLRHRLYMAKNAHGQETPLSADKIAKTIGKTRERMLNVGNNMDAKVKANVKNGKTKVYVDAQSLLEIPERLKESTILCPYNLPPREEADSAKSLQLLELIKANDDYHGQVLISCHSELDRPHDLVSLKGNDILSNFSESSMCDGVVLTFFTKCLKQDESQECRECVGYRLIMPPETSAVLLDKKGKNMCNETLVGLIKQYYTAEEVLNAHQIFIPVYDSRHWTLYVINFRHEQIDILDSSHVIVSALRLRHNKIAGKLLAGFYKALSALTDKKIPDFSSYTRYLFPTPPQKDGSNDGLFYVMSFMEKYNADTRDLPFNSLMPSVERRAKLLHYLVFHDLNTVTLPSDIANLK